MPSYADPYLPPQANRFVVMFGLSRVRVAIAVALHQRGGQATTAELVKDLGGDVHHVTLDRHLRALEDEHVVTADLPAGERRGRETTWTYNENEVRQALAKLMGQVAPLPPPRAGGRPARFL